MTAPESTSQNGDTSHAGVASLYAVLGDPVAHSLSPLMHNRAFSAVGYRGIYVALRVTDIGAAMKGVRALGFGGVSVTIPHKVSVMTYLDEIDAMAAKIGAVNTIVNRNGKLIGFNSDYLGAVRALQDETSLHGKSVAVIGAGGAARATAFGILSEGAMLTIVNRSVHRGEALAAEMGVNFSPLTEFDGAETDILINTTPVGMIPRETDSPVNPEVLHPSMVVMDIVYNPLNTRLLQEADRIGCTAINGVAMFVYQGAFQFELWTKQAAPLVVMKQTVSEALARV